MLHALRVGRRAQGNTAENPPVGCVIVDRAGQLAGVGWTAPGGRPHAEVAALLMAGKAAREATVYVTLEPCSHHGKTPPCAQSLIESGIKRVVMAVGDPDPRVNGKGGEMLRRAGIEVVSGVCADEARYDLRGFLSRINRNRPHVLLKLAVSSDGMIAERPGARTAITGPEFKRHVHMMRARADAILVGAGTVEVDRPKLDCRLPGLEDRSPLRVVLGDVELAGARQFPGDDVDLVGMLEQLANDGINSLMVEGGAKVARRFVEAGLVDEAVIATAPKIIGPQGVEALAGLPLAQITDNDAFVMIDEQQIAADMVRRYLKRRD